jgi:thiol-disulfide isomerase/thioredoxin
MFMKKLLFIFIICGFYCSCEFKQKGYKWQFHAEGVRYDTLYLLCRNSNPARIIKIYGETKDNKNWTFDIPDSVYQRTRDFVIYVKNNSDPENTVHRIFLFRCQEKDTFKIGQVPHDRNITDINAKYVRTEDDGEQYARHIDSPALFLKRVYTDVLLIPYLKNTEDEIHINNRGFSQFSSQKNSLSYDEFLQSYIDTIEKYPDSHYLTACVANWLSKYKTKEDLIRVYHSFSKKSRQSYFGKRILNSIENDFEYKEMKLPAWNSKLPEPVIDDSTRISLIVFSASWCVPCRKEIPLLKEIYKDLSDKISITCISLDDSSTVNEWEKMMVEDEIPWRSLLAKDNINNVKNAFNVAGIPCNKIVYPNSNRMEVIDVRINEDRERLYLMCGK